MASRITLRYKWTIAKIGNQVLDQLAVFEAGLVDEHWVLAVARIPVLVEDAVPKFGPLVNKQLVCK